MRWNDQADHPSRAIDFLLPALPAMTTTTEVMAMLQRLVDLRSGKDPINARALSKIAGAL
jgi:hypothetical protein